MRKKTVLDQLPLMLDILKVEVKQWKAPIVGTFASGLNGPFKVLISTMLSLRTKDKTTEEASRRLFLLADTPKTMLKLNVNEIEKAIYPVGFYHTKAKNILDVCGKLIEKFDGQVPDDLDTLLSFRGVGRKTANLVITVGYGRFGICVDTHVHRISNRWGLVRTKTPDETEMRLRRILPTKYWVGINDLLVAYGQNLCLPVSPLCSRCKLSSYCQKKGVQISR